MPTLPTYSPDQPVCCPDYECKWSGTVADAHSPPDNLVRCPVCECPVVCRDSQTLHAPCKVNHDTTQTIQVMQ